MKISKEKRRFLKQELKEYEKTISMTEEERTALHEWVAAGNSVHENGSMASYEGGRPMDFLDVYRQEEEIRSALASMSYEEGSKYLLEEYGIDRDGVMTPKPPAYEELKRYYIENDIGIFDDTPDMTDAIAWSDAYIGDAATSVTSLFGVVGKPLFILNNYILYNLPICPK